MMEKAAATFDEALQVVPAIWDSPSVNGDWTTAVALTDIAESQREAGLASAALATLARAVEAANAAKRVYWWDRLAKVAGAQARFGLAAAAAATIDLAVERARTLGQEFERAWALSDIARICAEIGLRAEANRILNGSARSARQDANGIAWIRWEACVRHAEARRRPPHHLALFIYHSKICSPFQCSTPAKRLA